MQPNRRAFLAAPALASVPLTDADYSRPVLDGAATVLDTISAHWESLAPSRVIDELAPHVQLLTMGARRDGGTRWHHPLARALLVTAQAEIDDGRATDAARSLVWAAQAARSAGDRTTAAHVVILEAEMIAAVAGPTAGGQPADMLAEAATVPGPTQTIAVTMLAQTRAQTGATPAEQVVHLLASAELTAGRDPTAEFGVWSTGHRLAFGGKALLTAGALAAAAVWLDAAQAETDGLPGISAYVMLQRARVAAGEGRWDEAHALAGGALTAGAGRGTPAWLRAGVRDVAGRAAGRGGDWVSLRAAVAQPAV